MRRNFIILNYVLHSKTTLAACQYKRRNDYEARAFLVHIYNLRHKCSLCYACLFDEYALKVMAIGKGFVTLLRRNMVDICTFK